MASQVAMALRLKQAKKLQAKVKKDEMTSSLFLLVNYVYYCVIN